MKKLLKVAVFLIFCLIVVFCNNTMVASASDYPFYKLKKSQYNVRGSFVTYYKTSSDERKNNIRLATLAIDNTFVDIGKEFSFNSATGERGIVQGYQVAKIIINGEYNEGIGGGVCQVSSVLYNAVLLSNLPVTEYHAHSLPVNYVEPSFDAMVNYNVADLKFKNNTSSPIIIDIKADGEKIVCKILGENNPYKIERVSTENQKIFPNNPIVVQDKNNLYNLKKGQEKIVKFARYGIKSMGELVYYQNGKQVNRKIIRYDCYKPQEQISYIGI